MKYKDYKFTTSNESMDLTYDQACEYFEETLDFIEKSKFDLFNDDEELSLSDARKKYNEINRRLQTFGQAFELFMKYIIHASRIEKNPNITIDELWNRWIRGHQMVPLINEKANSAEVLPNFKEIFNLSMNAWYGICGFNYIQHLGIEAEQGRIEPFKLFTVLQPQNYQGLGSITNEEIEKIIEKNTAIYEKCRYNVEKMTNYDFGEVFYFISFIKFFAKMVHISKNKTEIDYNVAYVHAMADDSVVKQLLTQFRTEKEIEEILNDEFFNKDAKILSYILTINKYSIPEVKNIIKMNKQFEDPNNLYSFLTYNIPIENIKKCNEKGIDVMLLVSDFSFEQIIKLVEIPVIGEYLSKNSILVNKMITQHKSDVGLTFEDWYKVLSNEQLKKHPEYLKKVVLKYMEAYHCIEKNNLCNSIFALPNDNKSSLANKQYRDGKTFSQYYSDILLSNISKNIELFDRSDIPDFIFNNIPVSLDTNNIIKINNYLIDSGVKCISPLIFSYPFNEVYAVINAMKNKGYIFSEDSFPTDFWKEYDSHAKYNMLLKDNYLPDEFLEENGLVRISERRYFNPVIGHFVSANYDNPLPNLKK